MINFILKVHPKKIKCLIEKTKLFGFTKNKNTDKLFIQVSNF